MSTITHFQVTRVVGFRPGEQVLLLLPNNKNKLLMQCKGPYRVDEVTGRNDYRVKVKEKTRTYHAYLLKRFVERRDEETKNASNAIIVNVWAVVVEYEHDVDENGAVNDEELLERTKVGKPDHCRKFHAAYAKVGKPNSLWKPYLM